MSSWLHKIVVTTNHVSKAVLMVFRLNFCTETTYIPRPWNSPTAWIIFPAKRAFFSAFLHSSRGRHRRKDGSRFFDRERCAKKTESRGKTSEVYLKRRQKEQRHRVGLVIDRNLTSLFSFMSRTLCEKRCVHLESQPNNVWSRGELIDVNKRIRSGQKELFRWRIFFRILFLARTIQFLGLCGFGD